MTGREIYKIWAPFRAKWVDWTRPVPFININNDFKIYNLKWSFNESDWEL